MNWYNFNYNIRKCDSLISKLIKDGELSDQEYTDELIAKVTVGQLSSIDLKECITLEIKSEDKNA